MKVAIYGRSFSPETSGASIQTLFWKLEAVGVEIIVYKPFLKQIEKMVKFTSRKTFSNYNDIKGKVNFLFSIGGDGTLLETVTLVRDSKIPVMGINTGRLGFLSSISTDEIEKAVDAVLKGKYVLDKRMLLQLTAHLPSSQREETPFPSGREKGMGHFALNEIAIQKADSSSMITIHASVNGEFLNSYWADGLIVATPTGSTAYSLSCGGPIVMPDSDNFIITPVAPHNLNVRPVIISSHDVVTLNVEGRNPNFLVSLDSRSESVQSSVNLTIRKAGFLISLVKLENHDFLSTLRNKLMWGADKRN